MHSAVPTVVEIKCLILGRIYAGNLEDIRKRICCMPLYIRYCCFLVFFSYLIFIINLLQINFHDRRGKEQRKVQCVNAFKPSEGQMVFFLSGTLK